MKKPNEPQNDSTQQEVGLRCSKRAKTANSFSLDFVSYMLENEPRIIQEALSNPEVHSRKESVNSEIESIMQNHTWVVVDLPLGCQLLGFKWILKRKYKAD